MFKYTKRPKFMRKTELLGEAPIRFDALCYDMVLPIDIASDQLVSNEIFEIDIVTEGNGICQIFGQSIPCKKGDIFIIPWDVPHNCYAIDSSEKLQVFRILLDIHDWFSGDVANIGNPHFCYGIFGDGSLIAYATLNAKAFDAIMELSDVIGREITQAKQNWQSVVSSYLTVLFITIARYIGEAEHTPYEAAKEWHQAGVAVRMVMESFNDSDLTLQTLADALYISKSHLSRMFKAFFGESFSDCLRNVRINHACKLLSESEMSVEQIVDACGMKDVRTFCLNFQKIMGTTPHQYRIDKKNMTGETVMVVLSEISEKMQQGRGKIVAELVQAALAEGCEPEKILNEGLLAGMSVIGQKFRNNEIFVPEVLIAARAMNMGAQILKPHLVSSGAKVVGKVCIGTVQGDLHDIGKNLVKMMMEGNGLEVIDLGTDVPAEKFVQTAIDENCDIICCSALLTTTMHVMEDVVKTAEAAGIRDKVKIMIGGAPVTEDFCKQIGADCYTDDAASAAEAAAEICKSKR